MRKPPKTAAVYWHNSPEQTEREPTRWIWDGVIAEEAVTLLSAPEKTGKTTLLSLLLDRRREGGQLLGREVRPGRTIVCSEEIPALWAMRQPPLQFGPRLEFHRPAWSNPTRRGWRHFINHLLKLGDDYFDLLVIDTAMSFLPVGQNSLGAFRKALHEFRVVANGSTGILLIHQMCTARNRSRVRGPLAAFADILIDMQIPSGDRFTCRRRFVGVGRYPGTLEHAAAELNAEGTDYDLVDDPLCGTTSAPTLEALQRLLSVSPEPMTRQEIVARWPAGEPAPRADSLWRTLTRGCDEGLFVRTGAGTKTEAFRYAAVEREIDGNAICLD